MDYKSLEDLGFILLDIGVLLFFYFILSIVRRKGKTSEMRFELMKRVNKLKAKLDATQLYP
jgi:hypothetical protein